MRRPKLPRGWNLGRKRRKYADHHELHTYENSLLLPLIRERGSACPAAWAKQEPGRWNAGALGVALERMKDERLLVRAGHGGGWWFHGKTGRSYVIRQPTAAEERAA